jgi:hypothetical protein
VPSHTGGIWLFGRLAPNHKTIADVRKDNGAAIKNVRAVRRVVPLVGIAVESQRRPPDLR